MRPVEVVGGQESSDLALNAAADRTGRWPLLSPSGRSSPSRSEEAVDLVARAEVSVEDVDTAMEMGTNCPEGSIAWTAEIGFGVIAGQLRQLDTAFPCGRYRPSPALGAQAGS
jgi:3-hydroxybutyryl-CoA dehydrogenase